MNRRRCIHITPLPSPPSLTIASSISITMTLMFSFSQCRPFCQGPCFQLVSANDTWVGMLQACSVEVALWSLIFGVGDGKDKFQCGKKGRNTLHINLCLNAPKDTYLPIFLCPHFFAHITLVQAVSSKVLRGVVGLIYTVPT